MILSTNIAETSITIPRVCFVVDTGMVKARGYNPHIGLDLLCVQPVSKAQVCRGEKGRDWGEHCKLFFPLLAGQAEGWEGWEGGPWTLLPTVHRGII